MPFKIVRNDITRMHCDAIVNTASRYAVDTFEEVGPGCDKAIYKAAGADKLIAARKEIGEMAEGEAAITPGFDLPASYIIHAVSPAFIDGESGEEEKLRNCYRNSLRIAAENGIRSIAFPLIATGSFGYPQEEGMRIAVDEINVFLLYHDMLIYLVVFGTKATELGERIYPDLEAYIDHNYVDNKREEEYGDMCFDSVPIGSPEDGPYSRRRESLTRRLFNRRKAKEAASHIPEPEEPKEPKADTGAQYFGASFAAAKCEAMAPDEDYDLDIENLGSRLDERMKHMSDSFSEYLMFLIESKGMTNAEVHKRAIVDKKVFSKIKNNPDHHPNKLTAMCLCVGAKLNMDETKDLLARAGYALSPANKTDVIFSYFIEHEIYDMIELDIQLEEHGLKCIIT
ncbi:MAG: macro domain-containing protein [Lachnospiraceae bacterium]|nr:macro domain-containing protein [Lachnospiraceae bacterium]